MQAIEGVAVRLLAAREHASAELRRKLQKRGFEAQAVEEVLTGLAQRGLLSDERFVERYVEERMNKGFGPLRIRAELCDKGVEEEFVACYLRQDEALWMRLLGRVCEKKFGGSPASGRAEVARRARFLEYRGFTAAQVSRYLDYDE